MQKRCYLLELAGELRNDIFEYALSDLNIVVEAPGYEGMEPRTSVSPAAAAALTMTCKQIHKECGNLVYDLNAIKFKMPRRLHGPWSQNTLECHKLLDRVANKHKECGKLKSIELLFREWDGDGAEDIFVEPYYLASDIRSLHKSDIDVLIEAVFLFEDYGERICVRFRIGARNSIRDGVMESMEQHYDSPLDQDQIQEATDFAENFWEDFSRSSA